MRQASIRKVGVFSLGAAGLALALVVSNIPHAHAQEDGASKLLKAMSDYVASQKTISVTYDSDIEVITSFNFSGQQGDVAAAGYQAGLMAPGPIMLPGKPLERANSYRPFFGGAQSRA